jgi:hypothetical protein
VAVAPSSAGGQRWVNASDQLGNGTTTDSSTPVSVSALTGPWIRYEDTPGVVALLAASSQSVGALVVSAP